MITKKELQSFYIEKFNDDQSRCWHCKSAIPAGDTEYQISNNDNGYYILFHANCFKDIAGPAYMIEGNKK